MALAPLPFDEDDPKPDQSARELEVWARVWALAQAVVWERNGSYLDVAMYVRHFVFAESGSTKDAVEARQWSDRLGLNPTAMLRLRWRIVADEVAAKRAVPVAVKRSASERMKARNVEAV